jgi:HEPN domain-containing protein
MQPSPEAGLRWLRQAEHDLEVAQKHEERGDYSDACFMAEQASQKALKGFLIAQRRRSVLIHSVARLVEECSQIVQICRRHVCIQC